jgi:hypothetical protein
MRSWRPRNIQDWYSHSNQRKVRGIWENLGFALFQTLLTKWDFNNIFYIALFQIRIKRDRPVLAYATFMLEKLQPYRRFYSQKVAQVVSLVNLRKYRILRMYTHFHYPLFVDSVKR